ncbi:MAG: TolC family protein [Gemmatimonadaceae bacterium]
MRSVLLLAALACATSVARGQRQPVTRAVAIATALARAPGLALARANSSSASALLARAREIENPSFSAGYTKSAPQQHVSLDIPVELPWVRRPRVLGAESAVLAAAQRFRFQREFIAFTIDTIYTRAQAAAQLARLSRATAADADSLVALAGVRRDAGDGTELDVQLAIVSAGQLARQSARDSLDAESALLALQQSMGLPEDTLAIALADSLVPAGAGDTRAVRALADAAGVDNGRTTLALVAAAEADLRAADLAVLAERRRVFGVPAVSLGFETHDPSGGETGILPTIGFSMPLPIFNRNRASVAVAQAERQRALAALALTRLEGWAQVARARRELRLASSSVTKSAGLLAAANRVVALSLLAYREGASTLPDVLAAQRSAREAQAQYVSDVAALYSASALVRLVSLSVNQSIP